MTYQYHRPGTIEEAFHLAAANPGARLIAGGTDLLVQMNHGRVETPALISLRGLPELGGIAVTDRVRIGATVPLADVGFHPVVAQRFPALAGAIAILGSRQIRNVATVGGNLCNASPAADTAPALLIYGASVELRGADSTREITLEEFLLGPGETALEPGEILTAILLELPREGTRSVFLRKGRVMMDLAITSVAALVEMNGIKWAKVRMAAGAVAPVPSRLRETERLIEGEESPLDAGTRERAIAAVRSEISPITDLRSTADYRLHLTGVLADRALQLLEGGG